MICMENIKTIAGAEKRLTKRLTRYWVFLSFFYILAILFYAVYSLTYGYYSSNSATVGLLAPRFLASRIGAAFLLVYVVGAVFLAIDLRARDIRERMSEVLDSRPYTNLELVVGRFLGIFLPLYVPVIVLSVFLELLGGLLIAMGSPVGEPMEIISLATFVLIVVPSALAFVLSLVFLVTLLIRNRLGAAVLVPAILGTSVWAALNLPVAYGRLLDVVGLTTLYFPTDITPAMLNPDGWLQRLSLLFAAFGMLGFSAAVHPRLDDGSRPRLAFWGTGLILLALLFLGSGYYRSTHTLKIAEKWRVAHAARTDIPVPDLQSISGKVNIDPGKVLDMELDLSFRAPGGGHLKNALFTLNPGEKVTAVVDATGQPLVYTHENGLLELTLPNSLPPGEETTVHLSITGLPDNRFAYLESAINPEMIGFSGGGGNMLLLGTEPSVFDRRFVALMPGIRWLPAPGPETNRDDERPIDFYMVDLTVDLPRGWLAAGPGRRHTAEGNTDSERFRFSPGAPVPEVALIASRFESRSVEIEGVLMEVLIQKNHMKNIEVMAETGDMIRTWIKERLTEAKEYGLSYPYDGLTLVEVPNTLRSYGGGWRMDTTLALPGLLLMRETSFPLARFDVAFREPEKFKNQEGGLTQAKWEKLRNFFQTDFSGGNIFTGAARNFFVYQTSAQGREGLALNFLMDTLSSLLVVETQGYYSTYVLSQASKMGFMESNDVIFRACGAHAYFTFAGGGNIVDEFILDRASRPEAWEQVMAVALKDMDPWKEPENALDMLTIKVAPIAQAILDTLGPEKTGQLLSSIRETHKGESYSFNDLLAAVKAMDRDLEAFLVDWMDSTALPGFVCSETLAYRLPDSEDGTPRYQLLFSVQNDESVAGLFRFVYMYPSKPMTLPNLIKSDPIRLPGKSAIRFGTVRSQPPIMVNIEPYLSLNRTTVSTNYPSIDFEKIKKVEAVDGIEKLPWMLPEEPPVIVDDLDDGFQVMTEEQTEGLRINAWKDETNPSDQGLPRTDNIIDLPENWSRAIITGSWGKYRHTLAGVKAGNGEKKAVFSAAIPYSGQWNLELYLPPKRAIFLSSNRFPDPKWGDWHLTVKDGNGDAHEIEFDSNAASNGWNLAGSLALPEGKVSVILSNETEGDFVIADAIRWAPVGGR